jgi:hypothetical protein
MKIMRALQMAGTLLLLLAVCTAQTTNANPAKIVIRILNGKTGKPARHHDSNNIWLGDGDNLLLQSNSKAEITIDISDARPSEIRFAPNTYFDCRFQRDVSSGQHVKYSLEEIISKGIVGENLCGKTRTSPIPGVLVVYVRQKTFLELMKL